MSFKNKCQSQIVGISQYAYFSGISFLIVNYVTKYTEDSQTGRVGIPDVRFYRYPGKTDK
jgi:hypothetical protein